MSGEHKSRNFAEGPAELAGRKLLVRAHGLYKAFGGQQVLGGASLSIHEGEVILLRGANGSGKTTLLNILTGYLEPDAGNILLYSSVRTERFDFPRKRLTRLNPLDHFTPERMSVNGIGRTWQDVRLFSSLDLCSNLSVAVPHQRGENPVWSLLGRSPIVAQERQIESASKAVLKDIGLQGRFDSAADRISLGQAKRISVARVFSSNAKIIFLDEPLAGLDASGVDEVMRLLIWLNKERNVTFVITEHDSNIPHILPFATASLVLVDGKVTTEGSADHSRVLQERSKLSGELKSHSDDCVSSNTKNLTLPGGATISVMDSTSPGVPALEVEDLVVFRDGRLVIGTRGRDGIVRGISFKLFEGQHSVLRAPNGWGKTTLLEALAGLLPIEAGSIRLFGKPVQGLTTWERSRLGFAFQQARNNFFPSLTVRETLRLSGIHEPVTQLLAIIDKRMDELSGGERKSVALACTCGLPGTQLMLLDEPLLALDEANSKFFEDGMNMRSSLTALTAVSLSSETHVCRCEAIRAVLR